MVPSHGTAPGLSRRTLKNDLLVDTLHGWSYRGRVKGTSGQGRTDEKGDFFDSLPAGQLDQLCA